jgi:hypothetical protein
MKLTEAFEKAGNNDTLSCNIGARTVWSTKSGAISGTFNPPFIFSISDEWEVIPEEPKVLSVKEYVDNVGLPMHMRNENFYTKLKEAFESGRQNGRLELSLEIRKIVNNKNIEFRILEIEALLNNVDKNKNQK